MRTNNMKLEALETFTTRFALGFASTIFLMALLLGLLLVAGLVSSSSAQSAQPKTFASPGEASSALFQAVQNQDEQALESILGAGKDVTSSSNEVEDKLEREQFSQKYQEMHRLIREPDGITVLYIGAENWPFPVPLVFKNGKWYFDSDRGKQEILFRRVGENEITAIEVCTTFATAKNGSGTKAKSDDDPVTQYAESLVSGGATSPESSPFRGYYFRIVAANSSSATETHASADSKTAVALVAYPAQYRSSGVETFVVTQDGAVFEKDLGPKTTTVAAGVSERGAGWHSAE